MAQHARCCLPSFGTTFGGSKRPLSIRTRTTPSQSAKLLSAFEHNSLDSLLKTAWALLLYRYTGLEDVCFGYQHYSFDGGSLGPHSSDSEGLLVCKLTIDEGDTINTLLKKSRGTRDFEKVVGMGGGTNANVDDCSLFNTTVMVRVCGDRAKGGNSVRPMLPTILPEECGARLHVKVLQEDICIFLEWWNTDISATQMESVARYFENLLDLTLSNKDITAIDAGGFLEHDWSRICEFNSVIPEDCDRCIHEVIREKARLHPQREAVCAWDGNFTYEELDCLATKLASHLQAQNVGPEARVALCFDKSKWNVVAMLGVLKAGGAFVPFDPTHPTSRLRSLIDSVEVKIMLCSRNREEFLSTVAESLIPLDEQFLAEISPPPAGAVTQNEVNGSNAAYLVFTSGSTGQPKGTLLEHRAFVSAAMSYGQPMDMDSECRILQFAAHTFDASLFESISPLIHGGCTCIPSDGERMNDVIQAINRMRVNVVCLTPSFVRFINPSSIPRVKTIILVGEAMSRADLETWSHIKLVNGYGPTESAVCAAINSEIHMASDCRDIGLPTGVHFWIVNPNDHDQLVPVGSPGELLLEGPTLARCYINNPEKTNEVFIYNPKWSRQDSRGDCRFYKTGDLVRYNSDKGSLIFIGRKDTQIKLHGQRIELGEIENNISTLPMIKHCITFFCKSGSAKGKIVAVISLQGGSSSSTEPLKLLEQPGRNSAVAELRELLLNRLPTYMIPSVWLCVESLPLLPSGKLNRKEIVSWATNQTDDLHSKDAESSNDEPTPTTQVEETVEDRLISIWSRVLATPRSKISVEDGFLALGGDSIAAITCMGYCKKQGMGVTVQDILQSRSIRDLATRVKEISRPVEYREATEQPFELSPVQKLHFMIRDEGQGYFNQGIRTRLNQRVSVEDMRRSIEVIVKKHSMLRSRLVVDAVAEGLQQRITEEVDSSYRLRFHNIEEEAQIDSAVADSQLCINAVEGPILSVDLFASGDDYFFSMVAHHLVVDIVSWRIILEDLEDILLHPEDKASNTQSLPFSTWCRLQDERTHALSEVLGDVPTLDFAYWGVEDQVVTYGDVTCETFELDLDDSYSILMGCHRSLGTEPIDVLLASLLHSFGQTFTDRPLPAIFNEGHGREVWDPTIDISRTVGWFTTVYPISIAGQVPDDPVGTVVHVKDLRRRVSDNGRQQFASRISTQSHPCPMELTFNYVGQHRDLQRQDGLFQLMNQMAGETGQGGGASDFGRDTPRFALFEISALAVNGRIRFVFSFSKYMKHQESIRTWIARCADVLRSLGRTLQTIPTKPTLSDFPMLSLTYPQLDNMLSKKLPSIGVSSSELIEDIYPCSRMQQGILLARSRDSSLYAVHDTYEVLGLESKPNAGKLVEAWKFVVSRHAMLRTLFVENLTSQDLFCQVVLKHCEPFIVHLTCLDDGDVVSTFNGQQPAHHNGSQPHHRLTVCETPGGRLFFRIEISHAAMDGVSIAVILRDLQLAYDGKTDTHKPLFKNFMHYLHNTPQEASIKYWSKYLAGIKPCLFPALTDGKNVSQKQLKTLRLNFGSFSELQSICEKKALTLSTAFTAAWGLTIRLFCNSDDVCFSYMTSLRDAMVDDIESIVGPVINLLACRMRVSKDEPLRDILQRVQNDCMQQLPHNSLSFIDIQHELKLSDTALLNTGISYQKTAKMEIQPSSEIVLSRVGTIQDPAEYPLFVNVVASDKVAEIELNYWTNTLSDEQANNVSSVFLKFLDDIVHHHGDQIDRLETLSEWNKQRIRKWNKQLPEETDTLVQDIIQEKAVSQADAPAIVSWDGTLTYAELEHLSSRLATYLLQHGVRTGALVPIHFNKSVWQVVAILSILKAGGVCIPRDKTQPGSSLDKWLIDNGGLIAVTSLNGAELLEGTFPVVLPIDKSIIEALPNSRFINSSQPRPYDDGYVVFDTDGSAVILGQRAIVSRAASFASATNMDSAMKTFQFAPFTSDMFLQELIGTFMNGGSVCIPESDSINQLSHSINATGANFASLTPSIASLLDPSEVPGIQVLALFGEPSTRDVQKLWSEKVQLHSFLGALECSSTSIQDTRSDHLGALPTIKASEGCCSWLVDPSNSANLVPVGCVGELVIEGPGVSRGHLCDETQKRSAESFIKDEGGIVESTKRTYSRFPRLRQQMFKTGYLARYNSDGSLVYFGRKDGETSQDSQMIAFESEHILNTIELPGYRCIAEAIDLGVEEYPETCVAIFILSTDAQPTVTKEHTAVISPKTNESHQAMAKLHAHLAASLSTCQTPSLYVPVSGLPLTPLGTVSRLLLKDAVRTLSMESLLEYDVRKFGEFWRHELEKPFVSGKLLLQPFSTQGPPAPKMADKNIKIPWTGAMQKSRARESLLCAWALAIHSYTQCDDIILGELLMSTEGSSRTIVPRRVRIDKTESIAGILERTCSSLIASKPFETALVSSISHLNADTARACDFETALSISFVGADQQKGYLESVEAEQDVHSELSVCPLVIFCTIEETGVQLAARYDDRVLYHSQVEQLLALFGECINVFGPTIGLREKVGDLAKRGESLQVFNDTVNYWKEYLAELEPCLFPAPNPKKEQSKISMETLRLPNVSKIQDVCNDLSIAPSYFLQTVWALVLRCYTGMDEVCFGYYASGKKASVGVLPCRLGLNDNFKLRDVLQKRKEDMERALRYQMSLFEIQRAIGSENPAIFNTAFRYRKSSAGVADFSNILLSQAEDKLDRYLIVVDASISGLSAEINFEYQTSSVSDNDMKTIIDCFECTLNSVLTNVEQARSIRDVEFLGTRSRQQMSAWNATLPEMPKQCAHTIIQQQALARPSAPAICSWDENFTYAQLDLLTTKLAHYLMDRGVGPEVFVGLCFEKSAWAVIAQVAVLKAGGAFASLDPTHPESRLQSQIADIDAPIVLCSTRYLEKISRVCKAALDVSQSTLGQIPTPLALKTLPMLSVNNAAYAIFTSGTTGKPKVTVLEHAALGVASVSFADRFGMGTETRVIQFSSYTFDVSVLETIITLMTGGCVCVPSDEERLNDLAGAITRMGANLISCTPSVTSTLDPSNALTLKTIINGGEKLMESQITRWSDRRMFNAYGPSEATVIATTSLKVDQDGIRLDDDCNSIGTAVCGRAWIVDPRNYNRLLPVGAVGELVLEGYNIARGYLNNVKKTEEVFITQPQWCETEETRSVFRYTGRMYRTGDLVRYKSDGNICFISRMDTQVKLNGQRIELEEIEQQCATLSPANTQVAVDIVVPETKAIAKTLAAFFTVELHSAPEEDASSSVLLGLSDSTQKTIGELYSSLTQNLPQVMIPKLYFPVRYLPLGTTGKLDRKGLRTMVQALSRDQLKPYMISNSGSGRAIERAAKSTLCDLWAEVLEVEPGSISAEDSFFGLGGDSFSAMKLVGAARSQDISLTVTQIYEHPVLTNMVRCCENAEETAEGPDLEQFSLVPQSAPLHDILHEVSDQCGIAEDVISDIYPCSPVQEGLLTLSIQHRGAYVARSIYRLAADVDIEKFKATWQQVADEFDILRTRIVHVEDVGFLQVVLKRERISWTLETTLDDSNDDPMSGNGGLLAKYAIVQLGPSVRYFIWKVNHALYDGWNIPRILKRAEDIYSNFPGKNLTVSYKLFIHHLLQRDISQSDEFWKSYLGGLSCEHFPAQKNRESSYSGAGGIQLSSLTISRTTGVADITIPELIRAAWAVVLSVHTGSSDVCFGETLMGRNIDMPGVTDVAGPVLTTVPMRIRVENKLPVVQYLYDVRQMTTAMIPHQHHGLQRIQKLSGDTALACNFQNLLVIQSDDGQLNQNIWSPENQQTRGDFFTHPLVVQCQISGSTLNIQAHHDELALDNWQAERLIEQFCFVLEQLLKVPRSSSLMVGGIDITSPLDKKDIAKWNQRQVPCIDKCAHDMIREHSLSQPQAPSICSWDGSFNYREMFELASSFAEYLVSCGVGPETFVPVCLDKSLWAIVTILSVLLAGGAFVPLDPSHPTSRHKEILEEIEADIILCSPQLRNRYLGSVGTIIPVSKNTITAYAAVTTNKKSRATVSPSNMAYAIFTSGSTGRPKGIVIDHRAVCSSIMGFASVMHLNKDSRVFQFASLTFDAAILEVLGTLMLGGCICVPSDDERLNDIPGAMQRMNVSWTFLTPSVASILEPSSVPSLKVLSCGGEALSREVVMKWGNRLKFLGGYGPTETVVFAVVNGDFVNHGFACIGYGIPCTLTWIVDPEDHHRLMPLGTVGELALEGPALAREYLKNSTKTAETFINEPAWAKNFPSSLSSTRRIYKTGDLVKYNSDGSIEYLGRKDHQVKLHGQRMELGEIEHRLLESQNVRSAVVILPHTGPLRQKLVAVISLKSLASDSSTITTGACELLSQRDMLRVGHQEANATQKSTEAQLPHYMVPQVWAVVKNIPMLVSGKLDRKRVTSWLEQLEDSVYDRIMQDYDTATYDIAEEGKAQENEDEAPTLLREIFAQVLNLPLNKLDTSRSFIYLGGDSITGMAVVSKARKRGLNLPLSRILQSKSIGELSTSLEAKPRQVKNEGDSSGAFQLSPIQKLFFRSSHAVPKNCERFNQSMTVRLTQRVQPSVLEDALRAVVQKHTMFRARFVKSKEGTWQQMVTKEIDSSYKFRTHSAKNSNEMLSRIGDTQCSLDVQTGPVFAADLFDKNGQQVLFLVASHLCVDVVSWRIVLQELEDFINTGSLSSDAPLSFQSWCNIQLESSKPTKSVEVPCQLPDLGYWGMTQVPNSYGQVKMQSFTLDKQTTAFISGQCHEILRTETIEVLLSAALQSFSRIFTDRDTPTIYNEGHGREAWDSSDPSGTVGWFTTLNPIHVQTSSDLLDTMKHVKDTRRQIAALSQTFFAQDILHRNSNKFPVPLEILFNYLGKLQQLERDESIFQHYGDVFNAETMDSVGDMGSETPRFSLFEITAVIIKEQLHVSFTYNRNMHQQTRIQAWMAECKRVLEIDMPNLRNVTPEPTLSDYPLLPITYDGLKDLTENTLPGLNIPHWSQVEDIYPCSPIQEGILLSQLRDPHEYIFNVIFEMRCFGQNNIDLTKLRNAWSMVVARHPILRTAFVDSSCKGESFDQIVIKRARETIVEIECDDSSALSKLDAISLQDSDKSTKVYHQLAFCKTSTGRILVKFELNHLIVDGGSFSILMRELALAYSNQLPLGSGPLFSDYIKYLRRESSAQALEYWKKRLAGVRPCHLPVATGKSGARQLGTRMVPFDRFAELQYFCETNSITLANLILAVWAIFLRSYTQSDDVCFGYPSTGRDLPVSGIQDAVGIFINNICCRVKFQSDQTLLGLSKSVQDDHIKSLAYQHASLAEIQHALGRQGKPLFNTCISIQNHSADKVEVAGISYEFQKAHDPCEYPLTANVETARGHEGILLRYWADAVTEVEAATFAGAVARILTCFAESPSTPISSLEIGGKENYTVTEKLLDRNSLEKIVDERIKVIIKQMLGESKLASSLVKPHDEALSESFHHIEKGIKNSLQNLAIGREMTPSDSMQTLTPDDRVPTNTENQLWRLWSITLGLPPHPIKYQDSFFKLGGDSITAMKMVRAARDEGMKLSVGDVFQHPVFEKLVSLINGRAKPVTSNLMAKHVENIQNMEKLAEDRPMLPKSESSQEISILRPIELDETSLRAAICPKVGVFKGGIVDVLPVTDFQSLSLAATMFESRWMLNYFYLDGKGSLDIRRLRESFLRVVDAFDILRTVFVSFHGQFFQVVLRKIRPDIFVHETEQSLDEYTKSLQQRDRSEPPGQGVQYVQFYVVRKVNSDEHRILIRMSHAQFDGVCLSKIMTSIKMAYEGSPISPSSFLGYMRLLPGTITPEHYQHWSTLLKGSRMTEIVQRDRPNTFQHIGGFAEQKKVIEIPSTATESITIATVMQSAWAVTLAKLCAQDDVVFGLTVSGRNAVPGVENTVGPCLNHIPIRVRFKDRWTALDLFRFLQDQQVANMAYESLGFREIARHCTDWPESTYFTTSILHQNVDYEGEMHLDNNPYRMGGVGVIDNFTDLSLFSKPVAGQPNQLTVSLGYSLKGPMDPNFVSTVLDMVCDTAQSFVANPNVALPSPSMLRSLPPQRVEEIPAASGSDSFLLSSLNNRSLSEILAHSGLITRIWKQVLPPRSSTSKPQTPFQLDSSFFRLGGDIVSMAQVVWILEQETGLHIRLEDLLAHSTFLGHMAVLAFNLADRDTGSENSSDVAPAYVPADASKTMSLPTQEVLPIIPVKSEWSALDRARLLAKKITKFGGLSARA